ncbi:MAG: type II secretion system protein [Oligoflexia bacterium]|nr:type II secretion system protein [Oligoflexia bacterium]
MIKAEMDRRDARDGFTLIEVIVVIALIAVIAVIALPSVSSYFQVSIESATRKIASTFKDAYNSAAITGNVYRLVYDMKSEEYWVESGPPTTLLDTAESKEKAAGRRRFGQSASSQPASPFEIDKSVTSKKMALPRGVKFEDVITQQSKEPLAPPVTTVAYTHIFPNGMTEPTILHLKDESDHHVSLVFTIVAGHTDLYSRYIKEDEAFGKK